MMLPEGRPFFLTTFPSQAVTSQHTGSLYWIMTWPPMGLPKRNNTADSLGHGGQERAPSAPVLFTTSFPRIDPLADPLIYMNITVYGLLLYNSLNSILGQLIISAVRHFFICEPERRKSGHAPRPSRYRCVTTQSQ
jgi:hypothetical protein